MYNITAEIYTKVKQFHYVKVEVDGVYISGIKVCASKKYDNQVWIQMPSYKQNGKWKRYIEAANDSRLAQEIYRAIEELTRPILFGDERAAPAKEHPPKSNDVDTEDFDEDKPVDLSEIPF